MGMRRKRLRRALNEFKWAAIKLKYPEYMTARDVAAFLGVKYRKKFWSKLGSNPPFARFSDVDVSLCHYEDVVKWLVEGRKDDTSFEFWPPAKNTKT